MLKLQEFANIDNLRKVVKNTFSDKGKEFADAMRGLLDELEEAEVEVDEKLLGEKVAELMKEMLPEDRTQEIEEQISRISNSLSERISALTAKAGDKVSQSVKNQIAAVVLKSKREDVADAVQKVLTKNNITGLTFGDVIDFAIVDKWGDLNPLLGMFKKVPFTKFFYTAQEFTDELVQAHAWVRTLAENGSETTNNKVAQAVIANGKQINTQYIYKLLPVAQEDMDEIVRLGQQTVFLTWVNEELDRQIANTIVLHVLTGTTAITSFEAIIGNQDGVFIIESTTTNATITLEDARKLADKVFAKAGQKKVAVMSTDTLTSLSAFVYSENASLMYRTKEEIAGMIGVDEIITSPVMSDAKHPVVVINVDEYWVCEKNTLSLAYPEWRKNQTVYQKERNIGGAVHGIAGAGYLTISE